MLFFEVRSRWYALLPVAESPDDLRVELLQLGSERDPLRLDAAAVESDQLDQHGALRGGGAAAALTQVGILVSPGKKANGKILP